MRHQGVEGQDGTLSGAPPCWEHLLCQKPPCIKTPMLGAPSVLGAPRVRIPTVSGLPPCREPPLAAAPAKAERENIGREDVGALLCHRRPRVKTSRRSPGTSSRDTAPQHPLRTSCSLAGAADSGKPRHLSGLWVEPGGRGAMGPTRLCGVRGRSQGMTCVNAVPDVLGNPRELGLWP